MKIRANGIEIEVEDSSPGEAGVGRPAVLLIMGLGMQLVAWPAQLVQALLDAGYRVIRHDNRDIGLSQHFDHLGAPNVLWAAMRSRMGLPINNLPYQVQDMAADSLGVMEALGIARFHVVGVSMGGMIAQRVALSQPQRVLSLISIMSSSGARGLPHASMHVQRAMLARPDSPAPQDVLAHYLNLFKIIGSPGFPLSEDEMRSRVLIGIQRSFHPVGTLRQMVAIMADGGRAALLGNIRSPALVLHGKADPLVPYVCGEDTARRIPGAQLVGIEGMGHDLAPGVVQRLLLSMLPFLHSADAR